MVVPSMYDLAKVMAESGYTEEEVLDCGITGEIVFVVVVPELGACRVSDVALSHFMAGADEFHADAMPEHWSNTLSGKWTIKRERLRILAASWDRFSDDCDKLAEALDDESDAVLARLNRLPPIEAKRWDAAFAEKAGRRLIKSEQAGLSGVCLMTLKQFCEEVEERLARWLHGRYMVCEAAQILADANPDTDATPGVYAEGLCHDMERAIRAGGLTVRASGIPVNPNSITGCRCHLDTVRQTDVNEWLKNCGAGYTLDYPYQTPDADSKAAPVVAETTEQRRARWLAMLEIEETQNRRGALQRVADREGVDRSNMSKDIKKARAARDEQMRAGAWTSQLVRDGKPKV